MRIGLIAALETTETGTIRAELPLAGESLLYWQAALMRDLGAQRILCLCARTDDVVLRVQHAVESKGAAFHALKRFAALLALVKAEDDLIILRDGLLPDLGVVRSLVNGEEWLSRVVAAIPTDHPLAAAYPQDFERIDATRHWAGLLVMRGAAVQGLADFPEDADAVSVLLRLALQAETPCHLLEVAQLAPETWLMADGPDALVRHEQALIARSAPDGDWHAPFSALAAMVVRKAAPRGLAQGALVGSAAALTALLGGVIMAGSGAAAAGLGLAASGAFAARIAGAYAQLRARLRRETGTPALALTLGIAVDGLAALALWFALAPWLSWTPLAVSGPLAVGLARLAERGKGDFAVATSDRTSLIAMLALGAGFGLLPEAVAAMSLGLLAALLLRSRQD